ncbi:MAG TPA: hypothetical protein VEC39_00820 [Vicinamibacterales bacterium]|nr:hypothetical protein [Vicinamibacterales bacterium]
MMTDRPIDATPQGSDDTPSEPAAPRPWVPPAVEKVSIAEITNAGPGLIDDAVDQQRS